MEEEIRSLISPVILDLGNQINEPAPVIFPSILGLSQLKINYEGFDCWGKQEKGGNEKRASPKAERNHAEAKGGEENPAGGGIDGSWEDRRAEKQGGKPRPVQSKILKRAELVFLINN